MVFVADRTERNHTIVERTVIVSAFPDFFVRWTVDLKVAYNGKQNRQNVFYQCHRSLKFLCCREWRRCIVNKNVKYRHYKHLNTDRYETILTVS